MHGENEPPIYFTGAQATTPTAPNEHAALCTESELLSTPSTVASNAACYLLAGEVLQSLTSAVSKCSAGPPGHYH